MKQANLSTLISVAIAIVVAPLLFGVSHSLCETNKSKFSNEGDQGKQTFEKQQQGKDRDLPTTLKRSENKPAQLIVPIYKPPLRGAPVGRVAGGTRGIAGEHDIMLCVLTPDHTALTTREQPSLYYYLGKKTKYPIELTVIEDREIRPLLETRFVSPEAPGIQAIHLRDYDLRLVKDKVYKWFVSIIPDPVRRSKDILAWGAIKRIAIPESVRPKIAGSEKELVPQIYAEAGIWYDAFAEISNLIETHPGNREFRRQRAALLEQVSLAEIAQLDSK